MDIRPSAATTTGQRTSQFRTDIQGLRAVAVLLVLAFHAGLPGVTGGFVGVDVFFVISGFLITGLIVSEAEATGRLDLRRFYARRIRRLLPATVVVLLAVAALTVLTLPVTRWRAIAGDLVASSFYVVNWRLADRSVDYLGSEEAASPVQHFWSLAVEEQFYVVWPLLILGVLWWHRRSGVSLRRLLAVALCVVAVPSLLWSVYQTSVSPEWAYFVSTTRLWELAVGALLALVVGRLVALPRTLRWTLGWGGMAAIVAASVLYDASTPFPGAAALLPTLGAAAVIAAGTGAPTAGVGRLLRPSVMQDVGTISYSLYLWHWPVLVSATALWGNKEGVLPLPIALLAVTASGVPAWFTYRVVENPLHRASMLAAFPLRGFAVGVVCAALSVAAAGGVLLAMPSAEADRGAAPGARVLGESPATSVAAQPVDALDSITPDPLVAADDLPDLFLTEACLLHTEQFEDCVVGDPDSDFVVAVVGDSHSGQWEPALTALAEKRGWRLEYLTMSSCVLFRGVVARGEPPVPFEACEDFKGRVRERLTGAERPDVVLTSGNSHYTFYRDGALLDEEEGRTALVDGYRAEWSGLVGAGIQVVALRNTPRVDIDIPECVATHRDALSKCAVPRADAELAAGDADLEAAVGTKGVHPVDLGDYICPGDWCPPVVGGVLVWRDGHHMSGSYARSLAPPLGRALEDTGVFPSGVAAGS